MSGLLNPFVSFPAAGTSTLYEEDWPGSSGDPWPSGWTRTDYGVTSNITFEQTGSGTGRGRVTASTGFVNSRNVRNLSTGSDDVGILTDQTASNNSNYSGVVLRAASTRNYYIFRLRYQDGTTAIERYDGSENTLATTSNSPAIGTLYNIRAEVANDGSGDPVVRMKIWTGTRASEPGTWLLETTDTDANAFTSGDRHGLFWSQSGGNGFTTTWGLTEFYTP